MKIVSCKNCGAKYQLDDNEDIDTFECSSCSGELELVDNYDSELDVVKSDYESEEEYIDAYMVQCQDCGLKFKLNTDDNILDYVCNSCGGNLRYVNDELNHELDEYLKYINAQEVIHNSKNESSNFSENEEVEKTYEHVMDSVKQIPKRFDSFFSEEALELEEEMELKTEVKTARTTIPDSVLEKFEKEFSVPKSNDYFILKDHLKGEFLKSMDEYYEGKILRNGALKGNGNYYVHEESENSFMDKLRNLEFNDYITILGVVLFIISLVEIFTLNTGIGIGILLISVLIICYGLYKSKDVQQTEKRSKIIREHLLALPEDYYVFYDLRIPQSNYGINHLVVGPTGIYGIISQKYNPQAKSENTDNENKNLINSLETEPRIEKSGSKFKYTTNNIKFDHDDKIKQRTLILGENLINFLNENNIKHCFVEPLVGFVNNQVVVINMPLVDEDLFIDELIHKIKYGAIKLDSETIDKCAVLLSKYSADCSAEI